MELTPTSSRIHPLMAGAAVSVTLVSLLGVAALSGLLPTSHGSAAPQSESSAALVAPATPGMVNQPVAATLTAAPIAQNGAAPVLVKTAAGYQYMQPVTAPTTAYSLANDAPARQDVYVHHTAPHHHYTQTVAQADTGYRGEPRYNQPVYQAPARTASPVGIATGAVIGGLLGNQVGGGNGRTLATVAGAVGGGYLGNVVGQKYGY